MKTSMCKTSMSSNFSSQSVAGPAKTISGSVLWANLHLLFWLSLVPVGTAWIGDTGFAPIPVAIYGFLLLVAISLDKAISVRLAAALRIRSARGGT